MIKEFGKVALNNDIPGTGLHAGTEGVVVMVYGEGAAYEVEFFSPDGRTIAVETIEAGKLHLVDRNHKELAI